MEDPLPPSLPPEIDVNVSLIEEIPKQAYREQMAEDYLALAKKRVDDAKEALFNADTSMLTQVQVDDSKLSPFEIKLKDEQKQQFDTLTGNLARAREELERAVNANEEAKKPQAQLPPDLPEKPVVLRAKEAKNVMAAAEEKLSMLQEALLSSQTTEEQKEDAKLLIAAKPASKDDYGYIQAAMYENENRRIDKLMGEAALANAALIKAQKEFESADKALVDAGYDSLKSEVKQTSAASEQQSNDVQGMQKATEELKDDPGKVRHIKTNGIDPDDDAKNDDDVNLGIDGNMPAQEAANIKQSLPQSVRKNNYNSDQVAAKSEDYQANYVNKLGQIKENAAAQNQDEQKNLDAGFNQPK